MSTQAFSRVSPRTLTASAAARPGSVARPAAGPGATGRERPRRAPALVLVALLAGGCFELTSVEPATLPLFAHDPITVRGSGFSALIEGEVEVRLGGIGCLNVHVVADDELTCVAQGAPAPGAVDLEVADTRLLGGQGSATLAGALTYLDTPFPELRSVYNFGPSLSAGVADMGFDPPGQINSIPGFVARQLGTWFPQRIVLEPGVPPIDSPNQVSYVFVGDGARTCTIPATGQTSVPAPGELCDPVVASIDQIPILDLAAAILPDIIAGILAGDGLAGGLFQDPHVENRNFAVPGAQMVDFAFGTRFGFAYLEDFFFDPASGLRAPACLGEPAIRRIADLAEPADLVVGYDWFFDSVLFSNPPVQDMLHQLAYAMLVLSTSEFHAGPACPAGTSDGTWRVPLIATDGSGTRTYQPYENGQETCEPVLSCPPPISEGGAGSLLWEPAGASDLPGWVADGPGARDIGIGDFGDPKAGYVVDWIALGIARPYEDLDGNGWIDIDLDDPGRNELTARMIARVLVADDRSDNPRAVMLSTMPWPSLSPTGGSVGGSKDDFADVVNAGLFGLAALFDEAHDMAFRPNPLILIDTVGFLGDVLEGDRPDLTHELDGDPASTDVFWEYELGPGGEPLKRRFLKYGGAFSLDHLHMGQTLNGAVAQLVVDSLNAESGAGIPELDLPAIWAKDPYAAVKYDDSVRCAFTGQGC